MALIKDMCNQNTPVSGMEIPDMVGGALTSDIPVFDTGASSSTTPSVSIHSRPLFSKGCTLIPTSQLDKIMWSLQVYDYQIKNLKVGVRPYMIDEI